MRTQTVILGIVLAAVLAGGPACKIDELKEPLPTGPSTIYQTFTLTVSSNVILAGDTRSQVEIRALVRQGNAPVKGAIVYFTITSGPGYFSDFTQRVAVATDENGAAPVTYLGPLKTEIGADQSVSFRAILQSDQIEAIYRDLLIYILRGN
jgi:hypothetical protein